MYSALFEVSCVPSDLLRVPGEVLRVPGKVLHDPGEALHVLGEVSCVLGEVLCDRDEVLRVQVRTYMFSPHPLLNLFNIYLCLVGMVVLNHFPYTNLCAHPDCMSPL